MLSRTPKKPTSFGSIDRQAGNAILSRGYKPLHQQPPLSQATRPPLAQAKLSIGQANDKYEQEADRVADQVMRMPGHVSHTGNQTGGQHHIQRTCATCANEYQAAAAESRPVAEENLCPACRLQTKPLADQITPLVQRATDMSAEEKDEEENLQAKSLIQRQTDEEKDEEKNLQAKSLIQRQTDMSDKEKKEEEEEQQQSLQAHPAAAATPTVTSGIASGVNAMRGGGQPLSPAARNFMEPRFGHDFSQIRVHTDNRASKLSKQINARAFTVGRNIAFASGQYQPDSPGGRKLLAHELTHVVQQGKAQNRIARKSQSQQQAMEGVPLLPDEDPDRAQISGSIKTPIIQRSTAWKVGTVHETINAADMYFTGGAPITWEMLNGTKASSLAAFKNAMKAPTISSSGSGSSWKAKITAVALNEGSYDETVLKKGPWTRVVPKATVGAETGLAACTGAGNSTFREIGKPSDDAVYKANRRHEDHHVSDHKKAFADTVGKWDKKLEKAKTDGTEYNGTSKADAISKLWTAMGGKPKAIASAFTSLCGTKGAAYHATPAGGPMTTSNPKADATCTTSSVEVRNPA